MKSFFARLFGLGGDGEEVEAAAADPVTYKGYTIVARPQHDGGQWRVAGTIGASINGETVERPFIRADLCTSQEEAVEVSVRKAQQIIDQNPGLFSDPDDRGPV